MESCPKELEAVETFANSFAVLLLDLLAASDLLFFQDSPNGLL